MDAKPMGAPDDAAAKPAVGGEAWRGGFDDASPEVPSDTVVLPSAPELAELQGPSRGSQGSRRGSAAETAVGTDTIGKKFLNLFNSTRLMRKGRTRPQPPHGNEQTGPTGRMAWVGKMFASFAMNRKPKSTEAEPPAEAQSSERQRMANAVDAIRPTISRNSGEGIQFGEFQDKLKPKLLNYLSQTDLTQAKAVKQSIADYRTGLENLILKKEKNFADAHARVELTLDSHQAKTEAFMNRDPLPSVDELARFSAQLTGQVRALIEKAALSETEVKLAHARFAYSQEVIEPELAKIETEINRALSLIGLPPSMDFTLTMADELGSKFVMDVTRATFSYDTVVPAYTFFIYDKVMNDQSLSDHEIKVFKECMKMAKDNARGKEDVVASCNELTKNIETWSKSKSFEKIKEQMNKFVYSGMIKMGAPLALNLGSIPLKEFVGLNAVREAFEKENLAPDQRLAEQKRVCASMIPSLARLARLNVLTENTHTRPTFKKLSLDERERLVSFNRPQK